MTLFIVNTSTLLADADLLPMIAAIQLQVIEHLQPAWNVTAILQLAKAEAVPAGAGRIFVVDTSPDAGALGEHDYKTEPTGFAAVQGAIDDDVPFSSVLSHEVLELLVDPDIILLMRVGDTVVPLEIADPVDDSSYKIGDVDVANFVLPAYYVKGAPPPYDHCGILTAGAPALGPGGYSYSATLGPWTQRDAELARASRRQRPAPWSRRGRR